MKTINQQNYHKIPLYGLYHHPCTCFCIYVQDYKVDLAMWAHHHSYQRTCPVYQEVCTEEATIHVVIGMAGRDLSTDLVP